MKRRLVALLINPAFLAIWAVACACAFTLSVLGLGHDHGAAQQLLDFVAASIDLVALGLVVYALARAAADQGGWQ